jgi:F-type H+-transporting ATPase subunit b
MIAITEQFGLNPILLLAQIVNFLILLFILKRILYKPLLKVLEERKERISLSLKQAQEIEERLKKTEEEREDKLQKASLKARQIIDEATKSGSLVLEEAHKKASKDIEDMVKKANDKIASDRDSMRQQLKAELSSLVILSLEKVLNKKLTKKDQEELTDLSVKEIS